MQEIHFPLQLKEDDLFYTQLVMALCYKQTENQGRWTERS